MPTSGSNQYGAPATVYNYQVSAVDTQGTEGPQSTQLSYFLMGGPLGGLQTTGGPNGYYDFSSILPIYTDTTGIPSACPQFAQSVDIYVPAVGGQQYYQPFTQLPMSENWAGEIGAFNYMIFDVKFAYANQQLQVNIISRITEGDCFNSAQIQIGSGTSYPGNGTTNWQTFKLPLQGGTSQQGSNNTVGQTGFGTFYGYITPVSAGGSSLGTLTVTSVVSGMNIEGGSFISGPGISGSVWSGGTRINISAGSGTQTGSGGTCTYGVAAALTAGSSSSPVLMTIQRTNMYKCSFIPQNNTSYGAPGTGTPSPGNGTPLYWLNNYGWTVS